MLPIVRRTIFGTTLVVAAGCFGLAAWQTKRLITRRAANAKATAQRDLPIVDLNREQPSGDPTYRRAVAQGAFDSAHEFRIRNRLVQGTPGVHIITPLLLTGRDTAVLADRGFVPAPDAIDPGKVEYGEPGPKQVGGVLFPVPDFGDGKPLKRSGEETWQRLDLAAIRRRVPYPVASYYLIVEADPDHPAEHTIRGRTLPIRITPPALDDGPHLSYAIQWVLIGGAVLGFGVFFVRREP
ncbi:MAG: SURF1 family protein [Gemmatimonadota bacterium]